MKTTVRETKSWSSSKVPQNVFYFWFVLKCSWVILFCKWGALYVHIYLFFWLFGFRLVAFNLGYLPGGDKTILTSPRTTVAALHAACRVLQSGGLISVMVYIGHHGGRLILRFFPFSATCLVFLAAFFWVFVEGPLLWLLFYGISLSHILISTVSHSHVKFVRFMD